MSKRSLLVVESIIMLINKGSGRRMGPLYFKGIGGGGGGELLGLLIMP